MSAVVRMAVVLAALAFGVGHARAENYDHPGLVFAGKDGWLTPADAEAKGYFEYQRRWLPQSMKKQLAAWEKTNSDVKERESRHYRIWAQIPTFILELEIVPFLDALYDKYTEVFKKDFGVTGKGTNKNWISIYDGFEKYAHATQDPKSRVPRARDNPGFFSPTMDKLVVFYDDADPGRFYATVFHEGAHQFVAGLLPGATLPLWLSEGLAVYFEGCSYSRATQAVTVDHLPPDRVADAQAVLATYDAKNDSALATRLFMDVKPEDFWAREYALAWSFVHYLINADGGKSRAAFARFLRAMNGKGAKPAPAVFEEATKIPLKSLQGGWRDYVMAWTKPVVPYWAVLAIEGTEGPSPGIKSGDRVWSLDGVEVRDAAAFNKLWEERGENTPARLVLIRRTAAPEEWLVYREELVTLSVPPGLRRSVVAAGGEARTFNLKD